jgi:hypothetical protein
MLRPFKALAGASLFLCAWSPAGAQEISGKAREAETLANEGKFLEAMAALDDVETALWDKAPLSFRKTLWVSDNPTGFGIYNPRESNVFASGAEMILYLEPIGFGWRKSGDIWYMELVADVVVKSKDGEELLRQNDFDKLEVGSRVRNREFMGRFSYTFTGIPQGEYVVETILHDQVTGKTGSVSLPFVVH